MTDLFLVLVNRSLLASVLILAVLLLRFLFQKAPKWIHCLLWALVAVELLCPFRLESRASLMPPSAPITQQMLDGHLPDYEFETPSDREANGPADAQTQPVLVSHSANPAQVLSFVWVIGMAGMLLYTVISYGQLRKRMAAAVRLRDNIYESDRVGSPFVLGMVRPKIYIPFGLEEPARSHVLAHEQAHIARRDHWWKPLGFVLLAVYWFNPLLWGAYVLLCRDIELACDEKVIQSLSRDQRADYSQALLSSSVPRRMISACPLAFGECDVKARIKHVLSYKKPAFWVLVLAIVACIIAGTCFLTVPPTPQYDFEADPIIEATAGISEQRSFNQNQTDELTSRLSHLPAEKLRESAPTQSATVQIDLQTKSGRRILIDGFYDGWVHIQSEGALYQTKDEEFCQYLTRICQGLDQTSAIDLEQHSPFELTYETIEISYESAVYNFGYTVKTAPQFTLTAKGGLTVSEQQDGQFWKDFGVPDGGFFPMDLTAETFDALFLEQQLWHGTDAQTLREHNFQTWQAVTSSDAFYALLQQDTGDIYLAFGYLDDQARPASIRWVFRLTPAVRAEEAHPGDSSPKIAALLDTICSSPAQASVPGDYITAHQADYDSILDYGQDALQYCFSEFLKGNQTNLRGHIMAQICRDIMDSRQEVYDVGDNFQTGQDWFDSFHAEAAQLAETSSPDALQCFYSAAWLLLNM